MLLDNLPLILALTLLISAGSFGVLLALGGPVIGIRWGELGIAVGFLAGFMGLVHGIPLLDNIPSPELSVIGLLAIGLGALIALIRIYGLPAHIVAALAGGAAAFWMMGGTQIIILPMSSLVAYALLTLTALALPFRLRQIAASGLSPLLNLVFATGGLCAIAFFGQATLLAELSLVFIAALAGVALWLGRVPSLYLGPVAAAIGTILLIGLAGTYIHNAVGVPWSMLALPFCFTPDLLLRRFSSKQWARQKIRRIATLAAASLAPALLGGSLAALLVRFQN